VIFNSIAFGANNFTKLSDAKIRVNSSPDQNNLNFIFGGVGGTIEVEANDNHAVVATARQITDGSAFYGYSSSGAHVAKFVQQTNFTSPAVTIWRDSTNASKPSEAFLVADSKGPTNTNMAINVRAGGTSVMSVDFRGLINSGGYPVMRFRGSYQLISFNSFSPSNPRAGDVVFISDYTDFSNALPFKIYTGTSWVP
jgi:hypothetical protein